MYGLEEVELCYHPSRNEMFYRFDGRWHCSLPRGHEEYDVPHLAFYNHDSKRGIAWVRPWVPEDDPEGRNG